MALDDRFDDLIASLGGFHRSWLVYLGLELGLFARSARPARRDRRGGSRREPVRPEAIDAWAWAADAHDW